MKAVSATTMRSLDQDTIKAGTHGEVLMERAGYGSYLEILAFCDSLSQDHCTHFLILVGKGNNGGDGYVIARYLQEAEKMVTVVSACPVDDLTGDALLNAHRLGDRSLVIIAPEDLDEFLTPGTIVVDALLGTGICGDVKEPYVSYIEAVNSSGLPVIAVDIPSGLNADSGTVANSAMVADLTVCMGLPKSGLFQNEGSCCCGQFRAIDIGIIPEAIDRAPAEFDVMTTVDMAPLIGRLPAQAHKGTMGRIAIIGSSKWFPGALALAGTGCLRSGGGLVTVAFPETISAAMTRCPAGLIMHPTPDDDLGIHNEAGAKDLAALAKSQDAVVIGPGLSDDLRCLELLNHLLACDVPTVLDADGLRVFSAGKPLNERTTPLVLTPHPGEMNRLLKWLKRDELLEAPPREQATGLALMLNAFIVLKGVHTAVASPDGRLAINASGTAALATGGTGDVLSGMIAAWLCQLDDPFDAIRAAVFIHGHAAECLKGSKRSLIADDLPNLISIAMAELSPHS